MRAGLLTARDRDEALEYLSRNPRRNLWLFNQTASLGDAPPMGHGVPQIVAAWDEHGLAGLASLSPCITPDAIIGPDALDALMPYLATVKSGLIKGRYRTVSALWERLSRRGAIALEDHEEIAWSVWPGEEVRIDFPPGAIFRPADESDLDAVFEAVREGLKADGLWGHLDDDIVARRLWVRGHIPKVKVVEMDGKVVWAGSIGVRRPEGWLVEGVYTWPHARGQLLAAAVGSATFREAFEAGATHVQAAGLAESAPSIALHRKVGFTPFDQIRTILFRYGGRP